ncbi:hypothetical protein L0222_17130 [bacterium]|nr:hypothetical protein [bacterium]MCI0601516.1 hypothetical protein [bacterium]
MRKYILAALVVLALAALFVGVASADDPWGPRIVRPIEDNDSWLSWLSDSWQSFLSYF